MNQKAVTEGLLDNKQKIKTNLSQKNCFLFHKT